MKREIEFRGIRVDNQGWTYGLLVIIGEGYSTIRDYNKDLVTVYSNTVGQFTGMVDKNGQKIFEGDIVECDVNMTLPTDRMRIAVVWCGAGFVISDKNNVVIGNIHDNPELLTKQKRKK